MVMIMWGKRGISRRAGNFCHSNYIKSVFSLPPPGMSQRHRRNDHPRRLNLDNISGRILKNDALCNAEEERINCEAAASRAA